MTNIVTLSHAQMWIEQQRQALGNPHITGVEAGLCEDCRYVMVYCELENENACNGGLPIAATFDLGRTINCCEFSMMREAIEHQFECLNAMTKH